MNPLRDLVLEHVQLDVLLREQPDWLRLEREEAAIELLAGLIITGIAWTGVLVLYTLGGG